MVRHIAVQPRAAETRQRILDAAVDLFIDNGYNETSLNDLAERAHITTGAFYYHFTSKDAVAQTLVEQSWPKALGIIAHHLNAPTPPLENVIAMTFALSALIARDRAQWIGYHLDQKLGNLDAESRERFETHVAMVIDNLTSVLERAELHEHTTARKSATAITITIHGLRAISGADSPDIIEQLAASWSIMLPGMVSQRSLGHYQQFVATTAATHAVL